jgi:hypothetical protein
MNHSKPFIISLVEFMYYTQDTQVCSLDVKKYDDKYYFYII